MQTQLLSTRNLAIVIGLLSLFGILSFQYAAAQTATTTDMSASSTDSVATTTPPDDSLAVTPDSNATTTTSTSTPAASSSESQTSSTVATPPAPPTVDAEAIANLEETYYRQSGQYLQVLPGNQLPTYESGTVQAKLGQNLPDNVRIDTYQAPSGYGYQIYYEENGVAHSLGNGPEASNRTFTIQLPTVATSSATSTAQ